MIDLNKTTIQQLKDAIALVESAKEAGISVESASCAKPEGAAKHVDVGGEVIHKGILCGLVWSSRSVLRVFFVDVGGLLQYESTPEPETQALFFALAGYRPHNPWKDGE